MSKCVYRREPEPRKNGERIHTQMHSLNGDMCLVLANGHYAVQTLQMTLKTNTKPNGINMVSTFVVIFDHNFMWVGRFVSFIMIIIEITSIVVVNRHRNKHASNTKQFYSLVVA